MKSALERMHALPAEQFSLLGWLPCLVLTFLSIRILHPYAIIGVPSALRVLPKAWATLVGSFVGGMCLLLGVICAVGSLIASIAMIKHDTPLVPKEADPQSQSKVLLVLAIVCHVLNAGLCAYLLLFVLAALLLLAILVLMALGAGSKSSSGSGGPVHVRGHYRRGAYVRSHYRARPGYGRW